jgi:hypothetical protein
MWTKAKCLSLAVLAPWAVAIGIFGFLGVPLNASAALTNSMAEEQYGGSASRYRTHPKDRIFETTFTLFLVLSGSPRSVQKPI